MPWKSTRSIFNTSLSIHKSGAQKYYIWYRFLPSSSRFLFNRCLIATTTASLSILLLPKTLFVLYFSFLFSFHTRCAACIMWNSLSNTLTPRPRDSKKRGERRWALRRRHLFTSLWIVKTCVVSLRKVRDYELRKVFLRKPVQQSAIKNHKRKKISRGDWTLIRKLSLRLLRILLLACFCYVLNPVKSQKEVFFSRSSRSEETLTILLLDAINDSP